MKKSGGGGDWGLYLLRCGDGTLYTGVARDIRARLRRHREGKGGAYTRSHLPVRLVYQESGLTRSQALIREARIKRWDRKKKLALTRTRIPAKGARPARETTWGPTPNSAASLALRLNRSYLIRKQKRAVLER